MALKNCFGYEVNIESRRIPCWKLVSTGHARELLRHTKDTTFFKIEPHFSTTAINQYLKAVLAQIWVDNQEQIFVDETRITEKVDIVITAFMGDLDEVRKALKYYDLDLIKSEKEMKVLVIRDPKTE